MSHVWERIRLHGGWLQVSSLEALFSGHMRFRDVGVATAGGYTLPGAGSGHEGG